MDVALGAPFNIASYSLLTMMIAQVCDMVPDEFIHTVGDYHLYENQIEPMRQILTLQEYPLPRVIINPDVKSIYAFGLSDFELVGYQAHKAIKMQVAV